jgi:hypothetical protein
MKVFWKNREYNLKLPKIVLLDDQRKRSSLHLKARALIKEIFPGELLYEEVSIPGRLKLDFFLPKLRLAVEVQGEQHFRYNKFFHKNKTLFLKSLRRDKQKKEFCELNQFTLVELHDGDWTEQLRSAVIRT